MSTSAPTVLDPASAPPHHRPDVRLRPVRLEDWPVIHEWSRLPDIARHQPWGPNRALQTRDFVVAAIEAAAERPRHRHVLSAVVANRVVGLAEVTVLATRRDRTDEPDQPDQAEIGYAVHPSVRRQGIGLMIARLATDHAFRDLGVHRVQATVDVLNTGSVKILQATGYRLEGTRREDVRLVGRWRDSHVFAVLEHEWSRREC